MAEGSKGVPEGTSGETGGGKGSAKEGCSRKWVENFGAYRDVGIKAPCKGCTERSGGCHTKCREYLSYKENFESAKNRIKKEHLGDIEATRARKEHMIEQNRRVRRGRPKERQWTRRDG